MNSSILTLLAFTVKYFLSKQPLIFLLSDIVTYEECSKDESDPIENRMFDPSTGTFTSQSEEPSLFYFSATSLLKSENNAPVYLQIIKHKPDNGEKVQHDILQLESNSLVRWDQKIYVTILFNIFSYSRLFQQGQRQTFRVILYRYLWAHLFH